MALAPALWPPLWLVGWLCNQHYVVAMWFAATVALTTSTAYAFLTAFGVRTPVGATLSIDAGEPTSRRAIISSRAA